MSKSFERHVNMRGALFNWLYDAIPQLDAVEAFFIASRFDRELDLDVARVIAKPGESPAEIEESGLMDRGLQLNPTDSIR
jgi:hypothetical protein